MLSRRARAAYYFAFAPAMMINAWRYRQFPPRRDGDVKVHFGPGQLSYLDGWVNVDANIFTAKCDVWADIRNPLPFPDNSVSAIYSHHVIEHLPDLRFHFSEMYRILRPKGVIRVGGPDGDESIRKFQEGDVGWFSDFPDSRKSIGGRFENFLLCGNEHLAILTRSWLTELAEDAGFSSVGFVTPIEETAYPEYFDSTLRETEFKKRSRPECPLTVLMEAQKP